MQGGIGNIPSRLTVADKVKAGRRYVMVIGILPLTGSTSGGVITYDGDGTGTVEELLNFDGANLKILADNSSIFFGAASDAGIYYDASDLVIDPSFIGSGAVKILSTDTFSWIKFYHDNTDAYFETYEGDVYIVNISLSDADTNLNVFGNASTGTGSIHTERFIMTDTDTGTSAADKAEIVYNEMTETIDFNFL